MKICFILDAKVISFSEMSDLKKWATKNKGGDSELELVLFNSRLDDQVSSKYLKYAGDIEGANGIQLAIILSNSDYLIFTTHSFLTSKKLSYFTNQLPPSSYLAAIQTTKNPLFVLLGTQIQRNTPFFIANTLFAKNNSSLFVDLIAAIKHAYSCQSLYKLPRTDSRESEGIITKSIIFIRPYKSIIRGALRHIKTNVERWYYSRKAEKLRLQVPDVKFRDDIPVFIICRDRLEPLKKLVKWCEVEELKNIYFVDNASTYPKLLEYFKSTSYPVISLRENVGHTSPWLMGIVQTFAKNMPFIVTDPDVIPIDSSHGAVRLFCELLTRHPERTKVGFGLKIDDLPDSYDLKEYVIAWEKQFWVSKVEEDIYDAEIDTTFALYRQNTPYVLGPGLRTGGRYVARHEPWYLDSKNLDSEITYYRNHANNVIGSWGVDENDVAENYVNYKKVVDLKKV